MYKLFFLLIFISSLAIAQDIKPFLKFKSIGFVSDFILKSNHLYVANDMGTIDIFNFKTAKIIKQIILPPLTSSLNKIIPADILSVDYLNGKILILSVGKNSYRNLWIYKNDKLKQIINEDKKLSIKEARFVDDEKIIFSTLGSDLILHDISEKYNVYNSHVSDSAMQDIKLSEDKTKMIMSDESGKIKLIDVKSSKLLKTYPAMNLDNVYKVAFSNGSILTAGQDRRVGVYPKNKKPYYIKSDFLVFCVGLSPSAKLGLYSSGENGDMQLFNIKSKVNYHRLIGHKGVINNIKFLNENELLSSERGPEVLYWKIN